VLPADHYRDVETRSAFYTRMFEALRQIDGVQAAGAGTITPLTGNNWTVPLDRADHPVPAGQRPPDVGWQAASRGYFEALQIPLRAGRLFDATDRPGGPPVVIISEAIRDRFYPGEDPVGRKIRGGDGNATIVGVVGDIRRAALTDEPRADLYFPSEMSPQAQASFVVRTSGDPLQSVAAVRAALRAIEPQIVVREVTTLEAIARESMQITRLALSLLAVFAVAALALAAIGIYGVMAHSVRQRTREIGMRVALGATASDILWLVMRHGIAVAGLGAVVGLAAGVAAARSL
jgi:putative ABC transport system permease protein